MAPGSRSMVKSFKLQASTSPGTSGKLQAPSRKLQAGLDKAVALGYNGSMSSRTVKPEFQPDGSKRQYVLDKAVRYILDKNPKLGTQNAKHAFLVEQVGLSQTEYLECLNRASNGGVVKAAIGDIPIYELN